MPALRFSLEMDGVVARHHHQLDSDIRYVRLRSRLMMRRVPLECLRPAFIFRWLSWQQQSTPGPITSGWLSVRKNERNNMKTTYRCATHGNRIHRVLSIWPSLCFIFLLSCLVTFYASAIIAVSIILYGFALRRIEDLEIGW